VEFLVLVVKAWSKIFVHTKRDSSKITVSQNGEPLKHAPLLNKSMTAFVPSVGMPWLSKHRSSVGKL